MTTAPVCNVDLYDDGVLLDPYPAYRLLRDTGPVVYLERSGIHAMARYAEVGQSLRNHDIFSSASGVSVSEKVNAVAKGTLISSDPPEHDALRRVMMQPLTPGSLQKLRPRFEELAQQLIDRLLDLDRFDVISDLAQILPVTIVSRMVGLPETGRENMLIWAAAAFNLNGPDNIRAEAAWPHVHEMRAYAAQVAKRGQVTAGGWADRLINLAEAGEVAPERLPQLFRDFIAPALDTTIFATASLMHLLGTNPDQWRLLKHDPSLLKNTINEAIRLESPIRGFTRKLKADHSIGNVTLPEGTRVLLLYGSANRDERKWEKPERFDIRRKVPDHLGFGIGVHSCAGMHLARLEIECIVAEMLKRVEEIHVDTPVWALNNNLRGIAAMPMTFRAR